MKNVRMSLGLLGIAAASALNAGTSEGFRIAEPEKEPVRPKPEKQEARYLRKVHRDRSRWKPHTGKKELEKAARRAAKEAAKETK